MTNAIYDRMGRGHVGIAGPSAPIDKQIVKTYTYYRDDGTVDLYRDRREWYEGGHLKKDVLPRQPGTGKRGGTPSVIYNKPAVNAAIESARTILLVEGEKCADVLSAHGFIATTTGSSTSWTPAYAEQFRGAERVTIWPDADAAGEKYAVAAARDLEALGIDVRVLRFERREGGWDAADFFAERGTDLELGLLLDGAPRWHPKRETIDVTAVEITAVREEGRQKPARFTFLTRDALAAIPAPSATVEGVIHKAGSSILVGKFGTYKTFVGLDLGLSVGNGYDWHGHRVTPGPVCYQAGEGGYGIIKRNDAWHRYHEIADTQRLLILPQTIKLNASRDLPDVLAALHALPEQPTLFIIDTYARAFLGNENSAEDAGAFVEAVDAIRETIGCHVMIVSHAGWSNDIRARGSTALPAAVDTEITIERDDDRVTLTNTKQKDCEPFAPITLEAVQIAGSLAFRHVGPTCPKLSKNERAVLRVVQDIGPITAKKWQDATGLGKGSFYNAKNRLQTLCYVKHTREGFDATDAGRQAQ